MFNFLGLRESFGVETMLSCLPNPELILLIQDFLRSLLAWAMGIPAATAL